MQNARRATRSSQLGTLVVAAVNPSQYEELARCRICDDATHALPSLAGGLLYVRDTHTLKCVDLRTIK